MSPIIGIQHLSPRIVGECSLKCRRSDAGLSGIVWRHGREGRHEEESIYGSADRRDSERGRGSASGRGAAAEARDQLGDLLSMEGEIRWTERVGAEAVEGARSGEYAAETPLRRSRA